MAAIAVAFSKEEARDPPGWMTDLGDRVTIVEGGETRGDSVWEAVSALPDTLELVAVHDAARPLVTQAILDRCLEAAGPGQGAVAGWPAIDTLKRVDPNRAVKGTLPRDEVWHAQTPQVFPRDLLLEAYQEARRQGIADTDDAALVERVGGRVVMVPGGPWNLKVTRPEDLLLAEFLLGQGRA
jgi:2-C-methyl-D-erythritol 4-phosphate cytidylyltransferase